MRTVSRPVSYRWLLHSSATFWCIGYTFDMSIIITSHRIGTILLDFYRRLLNDIIAIFSSIAIHILVAIVPMYANSFIRNAFPVLYELNDTFLIVALSSPHPVRTTNHTVPLPKRRKENYREYDSLHIHSFSSSLRSCIGQYSQWGTFLNWKPTEHTTHKCRRLNYQDKQGAKRLHSLEPIGEFYK